VKVTTGNDGFIAATAEVQSCSLLPVPPARPSAARPELGVS
jgi:hypothetical protein